MPHGHHSLQLWSWSRLAGGRGKAAKLALRKLLSYNESSRAITAGRRMRLDHVGLSVADLMAAESWYCAAFGLERELSVRIDIAFDVADLDATHQALLGLGAGEVMPPQPSPEPG